MTPPVSDAWTWEYDPDDEHVAAGLPIMVIAEVERLAGQLAILGRDAAGAGRGPLYGGGLRTLDLFGGRGFLHFIVADHLRLVLIVRITWLDE
ncbi:hypothetical protein AB0I81_17440 [Nonomuraea sp. NPDC050404]|uniref:hypothetical protein n=1 Tax=Nonomuraea sp. NPDC050404 TaxID=3155783 RepID=UPI0033DAAEDC